MGKNARILVIDDDKTIRDSLAMALELEGYRVDKAENGKEAITKSYSNLYNLAIVDWRLPDIEGTKLLSELKETTPKMARIMLTGFPSMKNAIDAVNHRADAFLLKPLNFEILLGKVKELLIKQKESNHYSQAKVAGFIETKTREMLENKTNNKSGVTQ